MFCLLFRLVKRFGWFSVEFEYYGCLYCGIGCCSKLHCCFMHKFMLCGVFFVCGLDAETPFVPCVGYWCWLLWI